MERDFTFQGSENWESGDLLTWGFRGTFGVISFFKILKNGNLSIFWKGFCVNPMELLESDSMPWNFSRCSDRRGTFGEMLKSETV